MTRQSFFGRCAIEWQRLNPVVDTSNASFVEWWRGRWTETWHGYWAPVRMLVWLLSGGGWR